MSTNNLKRLVLAMAAVVVATACSSGDNEVKYRYPDYESFCQGRAEAECGDDAVKHCSTSKEGCIAGRRKYCLALQEEKATYQPQHAEKCIEAAGKVFTITLYGRICFSASIHAATSLSLVLSITTPSR